MKKMTIIEKKKGVTLVELIIVIVIIVILATVLVVSLVGYADKSKASLSVANARQASMAADTGLATWKSAGSPGNGDRAYKINIENEIIRHLDLGEMKSFTETSETENVVQVGLSLPSYFSQGWSKFIDDCEANHYRNFVLVWVGKNPNETVRDSVQAIYYISADGKYATRIVYNESSKLGSEVERTGTYTERID